MPTLNKTKRETQIILKWGGISLFIIFLFLIGARFLTFVKEILTPPPPPSASFGRLNPIPFPNQQKENIIYSLDTLTGFLPNFSDRAKVYKINIYPPTLLALEKTREKVSKVGFTSKGIQIAEDVYQFSEQDSNLQRKITINIFSSDFTLSSPYLVNPSLQILNSEDQKDNASFQAKSFLLNMLLFPQDVDESKTKISLYSIEGGSLTPASKISNAKIVKVDFFQKNQDSLPIYYEKGTSSTMDFMVGKINNQLKVLEARYFHKNISEIFSTYAIKSASQALAELKEGKGYIASKPPNTVEITIKKVLLGYYMGEESQDFLMPIVVFEGDNDFVAYVSAVKDEWISN